MNVTSDFEMLPDEIILCICRYLRSVDILYSFFNLNTRLTRTISDYYYDLRLVGYPYRIFDHVISHVVPQISSTVQTLLINGDWKTTMSPRAYSVTFDSPISSIFPHVQHLVLKRFTCDRLEAYLENIHGLSQLVKLEIQFLKARTSENLLHSILAANNKNLLCISMDEDSTELDVPDANETYSNIKELVVNLTGRQMLVRIFALVPNVTRLCVRINEHRNTSITNDLSMELPPLVHIIDFELHAIKLFWTWEEIISLLCSMPSLEKLTLNLGTRDERLTKKDNFISASSPTLKQVHLFIRYCFEESDAADTVIMSQTVDPSMKYLKHLSQKHILFFTIPCQLRSLILDASIFKQLSLDWKEMQLIEELQINGITAMVEILTILQSFHKLRALQLYMKDKAKVFMTVPDKKIPRPSFQWLKRLEVYGSCELYDFVSTAPNLNYLCLDYSILKTLYNDKPTCDALKGKIVRLDIVNWIGTNSEDIQLIANIFNNLDHLVILLKYSSVSIDPLPLAMLRHWKNRKLPSFNVNGLPSKRAMENLKQWLVANSHLSFDDPFSIEYKESWFDLWL